MEEEKLSSGSSARRMIDALAMSDDAPGLVAPEPEKETETVNDTAVEDAPGERAEEAKEPPAEKKKAGRKPKEKPAEIQKEEGEIHLDEPEISEEDSPAEPSKQEDDSPGEQDQKDEAKKSAKPKSVPLVVKAISDFGVCVNGCMKKYVAGQIEGDYITAKYLLESGCPVSVVGGDEFHQCPNCKHIYK